MLIYNYQREFLGIDEQDLKKLGFRDLSGLRTEVTDFADLFVKIPGYIHNFKHVHWIDFITYADSNEESKVIINVNNKNYKCTLSIHTAFLTDSPSSKAFFIQLNNLRKLSVKENEEISSGITGSITPVLNEESSKNFNTPEFTEVVTHQTVEEEFHTPVSTIDPYESLDVDTKEDEIEDFIFTPQEVLMEESQVEEEKSDEPLKIEDISMDVSFDDEKIQTPQQVGLKNFDNGYIYDPSVASKELGLPLDLVEEFIEDFIAQTKEFKDGLYKSVDEANLDDLKILSHKLKGVAANLRIEDALEALTTINTTADFNVAEENLDELYKIISKLSGEDLEVTATPEIESMIEVEDELELTFKDEHRKEEDLYSDPIEVDDSQVPDKIDIAELADDTFSDEDINIDLDLLATDEEVSKVAITPITTFSKKLAANDIGLDQKSFDELYTDYLQELKLSSQKMKKALLSKNFKTCQHEALKLKGMSENMRVNAFRNELDTLINSSNTQELKDALKKVDLTISRISKVEA